MARKIEETRNQTDMRYIRRHPKRDPFPVRRLTLATALLVGFALVLLVVQRFPLPI
ncbi:MAG: hypothetical protein QOJ15_15 [Bradyrhizobium sp.]|jgi:hypothetical protein|nr:hypothetical protein [Bradyrhizobium sp.]